MSETSLQTRDEMSVLQWTAEELEICRLTIACDLTDNEFTFFIKVCKFVQLNPFLKQIYPMVYGKKLTLLTSIDGYRLIANRSGMAAGIDDAVFDEGLTRYQHIKEKRGHPETATVTVYKLMGGQRMPYTATAEWDFYKPDAGNDFMWTKGNGYTMLAKCAEALALRKAFPAEMGGVLTREEMQQAAPPKSLQMEYDKAAENTDAAEKILEKGATDGEYSDVEPPEELGDVIDADAPSNDEMMDAIWQVCFKQGDVFVAALKATNLPPPEGSWKKANIIAWLRRLISSGDLQRLYAEVL